MPTELVPLSPARRDLLARLLRGEGGEAADRVPGIVPRARGGAAPLSFAQEEVLERERDVPGIPPLFNECVTVHMPGPLRQEPLERALTEIVRRHEIWRTTFGGDGGCLLQVIAPPPPRVGLRVIDLSGMPEAEREAEAARRVGEDARRPFDMARGPLLRPTLVRMAEDEHRLYLIAHQIVLDGISAYQIFPSELATLYRAFAAGRPSPLPELPVQFADFARWQREWLPPTLAREVEHWRGQLGGELPVLGWPPDGRRPPARTFRGVMRPFALPKELGDALKALSRQEGGTIFTTLLGGLAALLHRYAMQDEIVIGTVAPAGRKRGEVRGLLGYFLNPVALRLPCHARTPFRELLRTVRSVTADALSHDDVPLGQLARELLPRDDPGRSPLFTVAASLQPPVPPLEMPWTVTSMDVDSGGARWDLYVVFIDGARGLLGRAQYNPDLFEAVEIDRLLDDLRSVLEAAAGDPRRALGELPLAGSAEGRPAP